MGGNKTILKKLAKNSLCEFVTIVYVMHRLI